MAGISSIKRTLIAKSNSTIVATTSVACFIVVFCGVASYSLFGQLQYQNRVIGSDKTALKQLKQNIDAAKTLESSYNAFTSTPTNIIGGDPHGTGQQDGSNTKIILDSLPSKYDFPALITSIEGLVTSQGVTIKSITATDDSTNQANATGGPSPTPQPMPFEVQVEGNYTAIQNVISAFERSTRPFQDQSITLSGDQSKLTLSLTAQTYWQPARDLSTKTKSVQ